MNNKKKSFILHLDSLSILNEMPDDFAGQLFKIIYQYNKTGELPENLDFSMKRSGEYARRFLTETIGIPEGG